MKNKQLTVVVTAVALGRSIHYAYWGKGRRSLAVTSDAVLIHRGLGMHLTTRLLLEDSAGMMSAMVTEPLGFVSCTKHATVHFVLWSLQSSVIAWF